jgi:hypothetical protein
MAVKTKPLGIAHENLTNFSSKKNRAFCFLLCAFSIMEICVFDNKKKKKNISVSSYLI